MGKIEENTCSLWQAFELHLISQNYATNTINAYRRDVTQFLAWFSNQKQSIHTARREHITDYLQKLTDAEFVLPASETPTYATLLPRPFRS